MQRICFVVYLVRLWSSSMIGES